MSNNRDDKISKKTLYSSLRSNAEANLKSDSLTEAIKRLSVPFSFNKDNKHPYAYANVLEHVGLRPDEEYTIASMGGEHLQFHRKNVEPLLPTSIQDRAKFFREKNLIQTPLDGNYISQFHREILIKRGQLSCLCCSTKKYLDLKLLTLK